MSARYYEGPYWNLGRKSRYLDALVVFLPNLIHIFA